MRIRTKLMFVISSMILFISLLLGFTSSKLMEKFLLTQVAARLHISAKKVADKTSAFLNNQRSAIKKLSNNKTLSLYFIEPEKIDMMQIEDLLYLFGDNFQDLILMNLEGQEISKVAAGRISIHLDINTSVDQYLQAVAVGNNVLVSYDDNGHFVKITFISAVFDIFGEKKGIIIGNILSDKIKQVIGELQIQGDIIGYITNESGELIFNPDRPLNYQDEENRYIAKSDKYGKKPKNITGELNRIIINGKENLTASAIIPGQNWSVIMAMEVTKFQKHIIRLNQIFLLLTAGVVLVGFFIAQIIANIISRTIKTMVQASLKIGAGDFSQKIEIKSHDELRELADSFNKMSAELMQSKNELLLVNEGLEKQVNYRTAELQSANKKLLKEIAIREQTSKELKRSNMIHAIRTEILRLQMEKIPFQTLLDKFIGCITSLPELEVMTKGAIFLVDDSNNTLQLQAHRNLAAPLLDICATVPFGKCLCGRAAEKGEVVFANCVDFRHDHKYDGMSPHGHYCIPILSPINKTLGVFTIYTRETVSKDSWLENFFTLMASTLGGIIQHRKDEEARRQSEKLYSAITDTAHDAIIMMDDEGDIMYWNPAAEKIFGYQAEEAIGKNLHKLIASENIGSCLLAIETFAKTGKEAVIGNNMELAAINIDGHECPVELSLAAVWIKQHSTAVGVIRDISTRKQSEKELLNAHTTLENVFNNSTPICITNINFEIINSNEAYKSIFGQTTDILPASNKCYHLRPGSACKTSHCPMTRVLNGEQEVAVEIIKQMENNQELHFIVTARPFHDSDGRIVAIVESFQNITKLKRAEKELQEAHDKLDLRVQERTMELANTNKKLHLEIIERKKAEIKASKASKAKSRFLANMSHEIRTPLNGIIGITEMISETELDENQNKLFRTIQSEAHALNNLINGILDLSKIEANKLDLEHIPFNLGYVIDDFFASLSYRASQKNIKTSFFLHPEVPKLLVGDPGRLRQILVNLMGNAIKFTPPQGEISLGGQLLADLGDRAKIRLSIRDTGIGIPKEKQQRIFESFTQADESTTRKYGGTGLGTTISQQIVQLMGGEIGLESEVGKGSIFWFTIFFEKQKPEKSPVESRQNLKGLKVLVVVEKKKSRSALCAYLQSFGCVPTEATSSQTAIDLLLGADAPSPFNLIISELQLPHLNGFDLTARLKATPACASLPVIIISAFGTVGDGKKCQEVGAAAYIVKPVKMLELKQIITSVMEIKNNAANKNAPLVTKHFLAEQALQSFRILIVEDYPTNQKVVLFFLQQAGFHADIAEDGSKAVKAFKKEPYDLILMDVQMPEMDGYQATALIRAHEKENNKTGHVPIVALTAHATTEDEQMCLAAGMDDYLTKPIDRSKLLSILDKWLNTGTSGPQQQNNAYPRPLNDHNQISVDNPPIDLAQVIMDYDDNRDLVIDLLQEFIQMTKGQLKNIKNFEQKDQIKEIRKEAHTIKGGAASLCALNISAAAKDLEDIAKAEETRELSGPIKRLANEITKLEQYLKSQLSSNLFFPRP